MPGHPELRVRLPRELGAPARQAVPARPLSPAPGSRSSRRNSAPARESRGKRVPTCGACERMQECARSALPEGESIVGQLCPGDRRAGAAWSEVQQRQSGACAVPSAPKGLSVSPTNRTTRKSPEMDALLCRGLRTRQIHPTRRSGLLPSAQPLSGGGENSFRSAERNLASVLMDGDPGDPGAAASLARRRGLAPGSDTPVLLTAPWGRGEQPRISHREKSNLPGGSRSFKTISKDPESWKNPKAVSCGQTGLPRLCKGPWAAAQGVWGSPNTFSVGRDSREGARHILRSLQGTEPWEGREGGKGEKPEQLHHHRGHAKLQPSPGVTRGQFWFLFCYFDGGQGRTNPWDVPGSKNHRGLRTPGGAQEVQP